MFRRSNVSPFDGVVSNGDTQHRPAYAGRSPLLLAPLLPVPLKVVLLAASWFCASAAVAQTSYPMLQAVSPVAAQVGTTSEHVVTSMKNMYGASAVVIEGTGVTAEIVPPQIEPMAAKAGETPPPPEAKKLALKVSVAAEAQLGVRDFRIIAPQGPSTLGQLVIVRDPVFVESGKNDKLEEAQSVALPATLCGAIEKNEDLDFFKFPAQAGQRMTFHVRCMRLEDKIHDLQTHADPILTLRNPQGATVAASDNHFAADPLMFYQFEQSGEYTLEVRDVRYEGNAGWQYSIEINDRPLVTNVYPLAVTPGENVQLELIGLNLPPERVVSFGVPRMESKNFAWLPVPLGTDRTNPVPLSVTDLPPVTERAEDNNSPEQAQSVVGPVGINGRIETPGDVDCFTFEAKKDEAWSIEVIARRLQSELDAQIWLLDAKGKRLTFIEDGSVGIRNHADPRLPHWVAPADGKYTLELRDLHLRGGAEFVYFLKLEKSLPRYELFVDTDKTLLAPGMSNMIYVRAYRYAGFGDEILLRVENLPPGVTAECGKILAVAEGDGDPLRLVRSGKPFVDGCIVLHAAADAPHGFGNIRITGNTTRRIDESTSVTTSTAGSVYQEIYMPGGGRGHWPVEMHTVGVSAPNDLVGIELDGREVTLKPGEKKKITVTIKRKPGFDKNVSLDVVYKHLNSTFGNTLPRGVTIEASESKTLLDGKTSEGFITLKADAKAPPVEKQLVPVMAHVSLNFVMKTSFVGGPLLVTVLPEDKSE
jgi:hypothetical protein